jgi:hypothetical protein
MRLRASWGEGFPFDHLEDRQLMFEGIPGILLELRGSIRIALFQREIIAY